MNWITAIIVVCTFCCFCYYYYCCSRYYCYCCRRRSYSRCSGGCCRCCCLFVILLLFKCSTHFTSPSTECEVSKRIPYMRAVSRDVSSQLIKWRHKTIGQINYFWPHQTANRSQMKSVWIEIRHIEHIKRQQPNVEENITRIEKQWTLEFSWD